MRRRKHGGGALTRRHALTRRQTLAGAGAALVASAAGTRAKAAEESKTFILVHGTWLGGWSWQYVRRTWSGPDMTSTRPP